MDDDDDQFFADIYGDDDKESKNETSAAPAPAKEETVTAAAKEPSSDPRSTLGGGSSDTSSTSAAAGAPPPPPPADDQASTSSQPTPTFPTMPAMPGMPTIPENAQAALPPPPGGAQQGYGYHDPNIRVDTERGGIHAGNVYIPPKDEGKMFIGGLNWETTDDSLKAYFSQFGEVVECNVMRDTITGRSRGFGFLTFRDPKSVNAVLAKEHYLDGKIIDPKRAIPREEQDKTAKIFVGGVGGDVTEHDFKSFFDQYGTVIDAQLMIDKDTGRPRGFGFVTFDSDQAVERIVAEKFLKLKNKPIEVKRAEPRNRGENNSNREDKTVQQNANAYQNGMNPAMMSQYYQQWQKYMAQMQQMMAAMGGAGGTGAGAGAGQQEAMQQYFNQLQQMGYNTQAMQPFLQQMQAQGGMAGGSMPGSSGGSGGPGRRPDSEGRSTRDDSRDRNRELYRNTSRYDDDRGDRYRDRDRDYDRRDRNRGRDRDYERDRGAPRDDDRRRSRSPGSRGNNGLAGRIGKGGAGDRRRR